ncbi:hypothetical protein FJV76_13795 [Mesorhizobium sp. WSM4303]|uniref:hypothetical protein n=1 Tax=unclassified Mesorhizobium TaxID=325217 RepID=UPI00115C4CEA|nr:MULTISPECIES: hypothetical protein [unclassified Mesorhizobium]TRC98364.1 hypothetical protein FJV77_07905 [Mesorhizobium sp. WSM4306]TRD04341.1 hypothetical protein FJV76_13795 [Mesorhizobium sp. WSM4303]
MAKIAPMDGAAVTPKVATSSYLEWGGIFGGSVIACAISVVLLQFGSSAGLALGSPTLPNGGASWNVLVAGLWVVIVAIASSAAGGYVAGRMRTRWDDNNESESEFRDGIHGIAAWALATLGAAFFLAMIGAHGAAAVVNPADAQLNESTVRLSAHITAIFSFATAAGSALGAAAAWFAAITGGEHRDEGTAFHHVVPVFLRKR